MSIIQGLASKIGISGRKKYETRPASEVFAGLTLKEKLKAIVHSIAYQDKTAKQRRNLTYYLSALYYQGYQNIELNTSGNSFDVYERDDFYVENQYRKHVDTVKGMLNKMEGDIIARPGSDSPEDIACARVSDSVLSAMRDTIGYERLKDQKNLYRCLFGNAFLFSDYVVDKKYGVVVSPKFEYQEMEMPADPMAPPGTAPQTTLSKVAVGFERRNKGSEIAIACSPLEVDVRPDIKGGLESLPYLSWHTQQDSETLNYVYPGLNIAGGNNASTEDLAQQYLETLANLPGNLVGDSPIYNRQTMVNRVELRRTWLQPCTFRGDKELLSNFPNGVHVTTVAQEVVDWYPEVLTDRWTHEVLIPVPHSLLGDGLFDAILQQDQINEMNSLFIKHLRYSTVGHKVYDATIIDPKDVVNDPANGWIPGRPSMDKNIGQAVKELPPSQLSGDVSAWLEHTHAMMEDMTSAYDSNTGKGMGANTPYSQSVFLSEKAQGRWASSGQYNKPELIRFHRSLLNIARDNWIDPRRRAFQTKSGEWSFEQFSQADLQGQVEIMLTDTDMKPRTRAEQVQAMTMLVQLAPIMPGMPPRQKLRIEEMLGLPPDANPTSNQISRAYRLIDRICKGETVSPLALVDDAQMQIPVFQDWLASEKGEAQAMADPQIYAAVYTYMITLLQMGLAHQQSPVPGLLNPTAPQGNQPQQGSPTAPDNGKQAGGQLGQKGGGPGSTDQPEAQSPAKPAPPVAPPSPS